jgi:hypothetical protein
LVAAYAWRTLSALLAEGENAGPIAVTPIPNFAASSMTTPRGEAAEI